MADQPIIVKKYKKGHHGSHGGAWKIAYADFVTAMMAFFLLMWLINAASEETKKGIAEYFSSSLISMSAANAGTGIIEGESSAKQSGNSEDETENDSNNKFNSYNSNIPTIKDQHAPEMQLFPDTFSASEMGDKKINRKIITYTNESEKPNVEHRIKQQGTIPKDVKLANLKKVNNKETGEGTTATQEPQKNGLKYQEQHVNTISQQQDVAAEKLEQSSKEKKLQQQEADSFEKIISNIKEALNSLQEIEKFKHNLIVQLTEEGIKIQIMDSSDREMFKSGSAIPVKFTEDIIRSLGTVLEKIPNKINITGHTDSRPYNKKDYGNWELSSDRAHSTRRILEEGKIKSDRFLEVNGRADRDPFNKKNTEAPENRRISITILYNELQKQQQENPEKNSVNTEQTETKSTKEPEKSLNRQDAQASSNSYENKL